MIGCIVTGHGEFAIGMTQALTMIAGDQEHYEVVPFYEENSLETFEDNIGKSIASLRQNTDGVIIFTDLMGGTPFRTAMMQASEYDKVEVITGTNLPMLIEIGLGRIYSEDVEALAVQAVQVGMQGVQHPKLPVVADEKENESELEGI
ncbi:PTS sugar transporter subunit IIA [Trichococcus shcherbakoviae]|uniref:PTS sugar transporter subunit IIA n=1 Tax=Trichococcus shcherbakoviae subsp. psychrophilus TaxID=2585775 RepID=A0A5C5E739_9LACT|nr:PTS sugar transporter subunit IIA [Trichococcus shcherbakoviae]OUL07632.1 PTS N-acetylgalactosamine IIA subunit [Sedimentibacter sp. SX930]TNV68082.1 PTS sugar transporter subunit IIA [Trichococcus shcherbakoviae subsp. psychrophilus]